MNEVPWYVIARRFAVMPIIIVGIGLVVLGTGIGWGREVLIDVRLSLMPGWWK